MNITQPTSIEEYLEVVQALSQGIDSYETLALRHEIFLSITEPFVQMAWLRCAALIESEPDLDSSLSLIGAKLNNDLMEKHETLVDIQTQMFSIRFVAARLASDLSEINFAALCSPISQDHWFWAVAIAGGLRIGSETFFNVTHNFRNPPEEIKEILPTVITKHQPIDKSLDQYKVNELNVSQPAINNSDVTTANALYDLGNICASTGQFEEALSQYDKAISTDNTNPMYYNNRASTLKRLGRINDALKQYREIIAKFPKYGKAYLSLASTHIEINNYQFSVNSYRDFLTAYERGQFNFNPVFGGVSQTIQGQNELETIIQTSINYLSSEQQKLALQAFNEALKTSNVSPQVNQSLQFVQEKPLTPKDSDQIIQNSAQSTQSVELLKHSKGLSSAVVTGGIIGIFVMIALIFNNINKPSQSQIQESTDSSTTSSPSKNTQSNFQSQDQVQKSSPSSSIQNESLTNSTNAKIAGESGSKNIRSGPGTRYQSLYIAYPGDRVQIITSDTDVGGYRWYKVYFPKSKATGWIAAQLLNIDGQELSTPSPSSTSNNTNARVGGQGSGSKNIRSGPGTAYGVIGKIRTGEYIEILDKSQDSGGYIWYQVRHQQSGTTGWIAAQLLNIK